MFLYMGWANRLIGWSKYRVNSSLRDKDDMGFRCLIYLVVFEVYSIDWVGMVYWF